MNRNASNGSCARPASRASTGGNEPGPPFATRPPNPPRTWSTATSPSPSRTGCGSPTSPEHPTAEGKLYCAAVMDAHSRLIIGWSIAGHMRTELVTDALGMAIIRRKPDHNATILHSDHGSQYTSWAFGQRLRAAGLLASMGTVGDCYDCETVFRRSSPA
nr:DDE-type integrase/transposase/recombinase [Amycolatopsis acidiphila]